MESGNPLAMPLTWGIFRPLVILPAGASEWPEMRRRVVLLHEFAHVARNDWFLQLCAEFARGLYWFHPLAWMAARNLRQESERACDDVVLNSGFEAAEYAGQLLDLARTLENADRRWSAGLAIARPSTLERRFIAMLNPSINRGQLSRKAGLLTAVVAMCFGIPLAVLALPGQEISGAFAGTIHDPSGAVVRNATVIMTNQKSHAIEMTVSDAAGNFVFKALPSGEYEMKVEKKGFEAYRVPRVVLERGRELLQNVILGVAGPAEDVDVVAERSRTAARGPAGNKVPRVRLGGEVQAAKILSKKTPVYPENAKATGEQGTVILHTVIGMDGTPLSLRVMNEQVDPELARAALEAVSQWRYQPTLLNGQPIEVDTTIKVNFSLLP
jgi:TonB family protein